MANVFIKPTAVVDTAIKLLQREIVLPSLIWLNGIGDFTGKYQDTITIRVPARTVAHTRALRATGSGRDLTTGTLTQHAIPVTLDTDVYNAIPVTDEELTLDITDFGRDVLNPQVRSVAEELENGVARMMAAADYTTNNMIVHATPTTMWETIVDARRKLNDQFVDRNGRVLVVGSAVEAAFLKDPNFFKFTNTGDQPNTALRDALIGRVANLDVIVSDALAHGDAYLFHPTAFIMATRPPQAPRGATYTAAASAAGMAVRWLMDYDYSATTDRSLIDTFVGYKSVVDPDSGFVRAVKIRLDASSVTVAGADHAVTAAAGAAHTEQLNAHTNWGEDVSATATWVSSDPTKATVSSSGLVTGVAAGTTNITAAFDGQTSANYSITVS
jgi:hypothetical protein